MATVCVPEGGTIVRNGSCKHIGTTWCHNAFCVQIQIHCIDFKLKVQAGNVVLAFAQVWSPQLGLPKRVLTRWNEGRARYLPSEAFPRIWHNRSTPPGKQEIGIFRATAQTSYSFCGFRDALTISYVCSFLYLGVSRILKYLVSGWPGDSNVEFLGKPQTQTFCFLVTWRLKYSVSGWPGDSNV